jgi:hypothetical protein
MVMCYNYQLKQSVDEEEEKRNIAALAQSVIGKTGVKPTVQLYMRLAFLASEVSHRGGGLTDRFFAYRQPFQWITPSRTAHPT